MADDEHDYKVGPAGPPCTPSRRVVRQPRRPQQKEGVLTPDRCANEPVLVTIDGECRKNVVDRRESGARGRGRAFYADVDIGALAGRLMRSDFGVNAARVPRRCAQRRAARASSRALSRFGTSNRRRRGSPLRLQPRMSARVTRPRSK
jgi:hypothetical protein